MIFGNTEILYLKWSDIENCENVLSYHCYQLLVLLLLMTSQGHQMSVFVFNKKLLCKNIGLNLLLNYNKTTTGYCSHNSREQKKN